jgi:hypothetical protein
LAISAPRNSISLVRGGRLFATVAVTRSLDSVVSML